MSLANYERNAIDESLEREKVPAEERDILIEMLSSDRYTLPEARTIRALERIAARLDRLSIVGV